MTQPATQNLTDSSLFSAWACVRPDVLRGNASSIKRLLSADSSPASLMAVVKAGGYGHGAVIAAKAFLEGGASWLGVTTLAEALELVDGGIDPKLTPLLIFAPLVTPAQCLTAAKLGLQVTVCDSIHIALCYRAAQQAGVPMKVHLKVDTGMGRLGLTPSLAIAIANEIQACLKLKLEGVYTHFANAGGRSLSQTRLQFREFTRFCDGLAAEGIEGFLKHCANSAAVLRFPECRLDMVRVGTVLYGQYPSSHCPKLAGISSRTFSLEARAVFVHDLPVGTTIGYGSEYISIRKIRVAVLPVGFADGVGMAPESLHRGWRGASNLLSNLVKPKKLSVNFGSYKAEVVGRIAMQMVVVDVTDSPIPIVEGAIATVPIRRLALSARVPRVLDPGDELT